MRARMISWINNDEVRRAAPLTGASRIRL